MMKTFQIAHLRSAGFQTCRAAGFQVGAAVLRPAGLETCGTADLEVCATLNRYAVFDRAAWIHEFSLAQDFTAGAFGEAAQADQRCVSHVTFHSLKA